MNGETLVVADMDSSKVSKVTFNGKVLDTDNYEYGFSGSDLRIAVNEKITEVIITIDGVDYTVIVK